MAEKSSMLPLKRSFVWRCEMGFSKDNEEWIKGEINKAIAAAVRPPGGFRVILEKVKAAGLVTVLFSVPLALTALFVTACIFALTQWSAANTRLAAEASFRTKTEDRLTGIEGSLLRLQISKVASAPTKKTNQTEATDALATAKKQGIPLPVSLVQDAGASFLGAAKDSPSAWDVAMDFVSYKSSLNHDPHSSVYYSPYPAPAGAKFPFHYDHKFVVKKGTPEMRTGTPLVSADKAVRLNYIGVDLNAGLKIDQPSSLLLTGGSIVLDGMQISHVVFKDVQINYGGGPALLNDVVFLNCSFVFHYSAPSIQLGEKILAGNTVADFNSLHES